MYMDIGMDTGDMILKEEVEIGEDETTGELWGRLSKIGGTLLVKTINLIEKGKAPREKQGEDYTVAPMLSKEMAQIDWNKKSSKDIKNLVRGLDPIIGAYTFKNNKKIKIWKVNIISKEEFSIRFNIEVQKYKNGEVLLANDKQGLFIKANDAIINVIELQAENSKRMNAKDYLRGNRII